MVKKALITGISGQDGSFLAELLLNKGYEVYGIIRRSSSFNTKRIDHIFDKLKLYYGDVTDSLSIDDIIQKVQPDELYHLAAQSHVKVSFDIPNYTAQVDAVGTLNILEAIRKHAPLCKCYLAETSELFGGLEYNKKNGVYDETCAFHPRSPYGVAKLYSYWLGINYKEAYNMFISNGILFNHGSERRGGNFVEKKIVDGLISLKKDINNNTLKLGNLYAKRDIGYAKEYVEAMWLILQQNNPDNFVISTNEAYSIKEMCDIVLKYLCFNYEWVGEGLNEKCVEINSKKVLIEIDEKYFRPTEVDILIGCSNKAKNVLEWEAKTKLPELLKIMVDYGAIEQNLHMWT